MKMRHKNLKVDIRRKTQTKAISDFLRRLMPDTATSNCNKEVHSYSPSPEPELAKELIIPKVEAAKYPPQKK